MQETIKIGEARVKPGQQVTVNLPLARLYSHTEMSIPVHVINGKKPGPRLFVSAAVHGDEINGVEIIRRLFNLKLLKKVRGTLILVPIVNIYGFINRSRYLPDRRDLNRSFPGTSSGSLASQLARLFMDEIVVHCTHGIDLHTGSHHRTNFPQIRACLDNETTERFARAFGARVILDARLRDGSLREAVTEMGIPMLLYEGGEALRFDDTAIRTGLRGILSAMREIGLLGKAASPSPSIEPLIAKSTKWVRAPASGILSKGVRLGKVVRKEEIIGLISDPISQDTVPVPSARDGAVISRFDLPLVHQGDALFQIASVEGPDNFELSLTDLDYEI